MPDWPVHAGMKQKPLIRVSAREWVDVDCQQRKPRSGVGGRCGPCGGEDVVINDGGSSMMASRPNKACSRGRLPVVTEYGFGCENTSATIISNNITPITTNTYQQIPTNIQITSTHQHNNNNNNNTNKYK